MIFLDPVKNYELEFALVEVNRINNSPYQRSLSTGLVNKLKMSIMHGFFIPLLLVKNGEGYDLLDGQHRLEALKKEVVDEEELVVPAVIVPSHLRALPLIYNVEKTDNIKDKATKVYNLYTDTVVEDEEMLEVDLAGAVSYLPHLLSIAFSYKEYELKSPSLVEAFVKKADKSFFRAPIGAAVEDRRVMGKRIAELAETVENTASDYSIRDFFLKQAIISQTSKKLWGTRKVDDEFDTAINRMIEGINSTNWGWMKNK